MEGFVETRMNHPHVLGGTRLAAPDVGSRPARWLSEVRYEKNCEWANLQCAMYLTI